MIVDNCPARHSAALSSFFLLPNTTDHAQPCDGEVKVVAQSGRTFCYPPLYFVKWKSDVWTLKSELSKFNITRIYLEVAKLEIWTTKSFLEATFINRPTVISCVTKTVRVHNWPYADRVVTLYLYLNYIVLSGLLWWHCLRVSFCWVGISWHQFKWNAVTFLKPLN